MTITTISGRSLLTAALLAIIAASILFAAGKAPLAQAKPADVGSQVQALAVAGSEIRVFVLDKDMEDLQWQGGIEDPLGATLAWDTWGSHGDFTTAGVFTDVEEGEYTVTPASPPAAGWEVYGYRIIAGGGWDDCGLDTLDYTDGPTFEVTPANPDWVVCVAVIPEGGIPGSLLTVQFVGANAPGPWAGKLDVPFPNTGPTFQDLMGVNTSGHWHNGKPGTYWTHPTNTPKPGLWTYGYYSFETADPNPDCPMDLSLYNATKTYVGISVEKPHWAQCIMVVDSIPDLRVTLKVEGPLGVPWAGMLLGTTTTWSDWGVNAGSLVGSRTDIEPKLHIFVPADPVAPGWTVVGYASFHSTDPDPTCPTNLQDYTPYGQAYVTPSAPAWAICVKVAPVTVLEGTKLWVRVNSQDGPLGWVDGPGDFDFSWAYMGVGPANSTGYRENVPPGTYTAVSLVPPLPGMEVAGYYNAESDEPFSACPITGDLYEPATGSVTISAQQPIWTICVWLVESQEEEEPAEPDPAPTQPPSTPTPPADPTVIPPMDVPNYNDPGMPGHVADVPTATPTPPATVTPEPTGETPSGTPDDPTPEPPTATSEPTGATPEANDPPAGGQGNQGGVTGNATPVAPNTGDSAPAQDTPSTWLALSIMFAAIAVAAGLAAKQLPGRRKR